MKARFLNSAQISIFICSCFNNLVHSFVPYNKRPSADEEMTIRLPLRHLKKIETFYLPVICCIITGLLLQVNLDLSYVSFHRHDISSFFFFYSVADSE